MKTIEASYILHRNKRRIKILFEPDEEISSLMKKISGAKFSKTLRSWHIPCHKNAYIHFRDNLPKGWKLIEIKDNYADTIPVAVIKPGVKEPIADKNIKSINVDRIFHATFILNDANKQALHAFERELELKSYSESTIRTYKHEFFSFLSILDKREAKHISAEELKRYMHYCVMVLQLSEHTLHSRLNALKFYYEQLLRKDKFFFEIPRPKKPFQLPRVLGEQEIGQLFSALENKKHKAILFTAYSAGLRVSEVISLQLKDIDSDRM